MESSYREKLWDPFREEFVIEIVEKAYQRLDYSVANLHRDERVNENGADLLCEKDDEEIAIQVKILPGMRQVAGQSNKAGFVYVGNA